MVKERSIVNKPLFQTKEIGNLNRHLKRKISMNDFTMNLQMKQYTQRVVPLSTNSKAFVPQPPRVGASGHPMKGTSFAALCVVALQLSILGCFEDTKPLLS